MQNEYKSPHSIIYGRAKKIQNMDCIAVLAQSFSVKIEGRTKTEEIMKCITPVKYIEKVSTKSFTGKQ